MNVPKFRHGPLITGHGSPGLPLFTGPPPLATDDGLLITDHHPLRPLATGHMPLLPLLLALLAFVFPSAPAAEPLTANPAVYPPPPDFLSANIPIPDRLWADIQTNWYYTGVPLIGVYP